MAAPRVNFRAILGAALVLAPVLAAGFGVQTFLQRAARVEQELRVRSIDAIEVRSRSEELQNFVRTALRAVRHIQSQPISEAKQQAAVRALLTQMEANDDLYLFAYTTQGLCKVHAKLPELVDTNQWEMEDAKGEKVIQKLIAQARKNGGYVQYWWHRPSTGRIEPKLGYVELDGKWEWMIGTGLYLDQFADVRQELEAQSAVAHEQMRHKVWTVLAAALGLSAAGVGLLWQSRRPAA